MKGPSDSGWGTWEDEAPPHEGMGGPSAPPSLEERPAVATSDEVSEPSTSGASQRDDGFIHHKVLKTDTLAGLAVKYGIHVSDIKRVNGFLSDTAMFAREHILIPTKQLPIGEDAQVLFARLLSGYGRDASLNAKERKAPGSVAVVQLPGSPMAVHSRCGSEEDDTGTPYSRRSDRSASEPGDVELMERQGAGGEFLANGAAGGYGSDRVRRRNRASNADAAAAALHNAGAAALAAAGALGTMAGGVADAAVAWLSAPAGGALGGAGGGGGGASSGFAAAAAAPRRASARDSAADVVEATWQQLTGVTSSLVEKIKRAASQPALGPPMARGGHGGGGGGGGLGDAAEMLLRAPPRPPSASALSSMGLGGGEARLRPAAAAAAAAAAKKPGCAKND